MILQQGNKLLIWLVLVIIFFSCHPADKKHGTITGKLNHANQIMVYLHHVREGGEETLDSSKTDPSGAFSLNNRADSLDYYVFRTSPADVVFLVLHGGEDIEITGDAKNLESTYEVKGSEDSRLIKSLRNYETLLGDSLNKIYVQARDTNPQSKDSIGPVLQFYYNSMMEEFARNFIQQHISSIVSLSATKFLSQDQDLPLMEKLEDNLVKSFPANKYVQDYRNFLNELKKLPPGSMAPEISLKTPDGKTIQLSSLRGKTVLIDFWASWCGPCRQLNPELVALYRNLYNDRFEILGVSLDDNLSSWKNAIEKDGITWPQVSELKKWDSEVVQSYHFDAIPFSVLVDPEGKIVAKGLRGRDLEAKIRETMSKKS